MANGVVSIVHICKASRPNLFAIPEAPLFSFVLQDIEARIGVGEIHHAVGIDKDIARLNDSCGIWPLVDNSFRRWWHEIGDFPWLKTVADVVNAQPRIVIGRKNEIFGLRRAWPVFMQIVWPKFCALGAEIFLRGGGQGRD